MKVAALLALLAVSAHAELKWETVRREFTYAPGTSVFKTDFAFTNQGKSPVRITSVKSGCKCCTSTQAMKKLSYSPGERGAISVKVDVRGKQLPMTKPVLVAADDGTFSTLLVTVTTKDGASARVPRWGK